MSQTIQTPALAFSQLPTQQDAPLSFGQRFASATMEYLKFVSGSIVVAFLCMATYALFHGLQKTSSDANEWLLSLSVLANFAFVFFSFLAGRSFATRKLDALVAKLVSKELKKRDMTHALHGMGNHVTQD